MEICKNSAILASELTTTCDWLTQMTGRHLNAKDVQYAFFNLY